MTFDNYCQLQLQIQNTSTATFFQTVSGSRVDKSPTTLLLYCVTLPSRVFYRHLMKKKKRLLCHGSIPPPTPPAARNAEKTIFISSHPHKNANTSTKLRLPLHYNPGSTGGGGVWLGCVESNAPYVNVDPRQKTEAQYVDIDRQGCCSIRLVGGDGE